MSARSGRPAPRRRRAGLRRKNRPGSLEISSARRASGVRLPSCHPFCRQPYVATRELGREAALGTVGVELRRWMGRGRRHAGDHGGPPGRRTLRPCPPRRARPVPRRCGDVTLATAKTDAILTLDHGIPLKAHRALGGSQRSGNPRGGLPQAAPAGHHGGRGSDGWHLRRRSGRGGRSGKGGRRERCGGLTGFVWPRVCQRPIRDQANGPLTSVGVAGFEPTTSSSRTKRAAKLRYTPIVAARRGDVVYFSPPVA